jgi:hypothetical protein
MSVRVRPRLAATLLLTGVGLSSAVRAQGSPQADGVVTLFENMRIFGGKGPTLCAPSNVLASAPTFCPVTKSSHHTGHRLAGDHHVG